MDRPYFENLTIRYLAGEATSVERETLEQAIAKTTELQLQFKELKKIWQTSNAGTNQVDVDLAWQDISERLALDTPVVNTMPTRRHDPSRRVLAEM